MGLIIEVMLGCYVDFNIRFIANENIEKTFPIKFFGVILDENASWKDHIHTIEKKLAENFGLLYRAKQLLNVESHKIIYFS